MKLKLLSAVIFTAVSATAFSATEQTFSDGSKIKLNEQSIGSDLRIYKNKPVLAISNPDKNKVSHNYFDTFNVGDSGMYIGNAKKASLIIAEVVGNTSSSLKGNMDVIMNPANLVIANPNGITCSGCSFTNAPEVTFTTTNIDMVYSSGNIEHYKNSEGALTITDSTLSGLKKLSLISDNILISKSNITVPELNIHLIKPEGKEATWDAITGSNINYNFTDINRTPSTLHIDEDSTLHANKMNINLNESSFINDGSLKGNQLTVNNTIWKDNHDSDSPDKPQLTMTNNGYIGSRMFTIKSTPYSEYINDNDADKSTFINNGYIASHLNFDLNNSDFINNNVITRSDVGGNTKLKLKNSKFINNKNFLTSDISVSHRGTSEFINNGDIFTGYLSDSSENNPFTGKEDTVSYKLNDNGNIYMLDRAKKMYIKKDF